MITRTLLLSLALSLPVAALAQPATTPAATPAPAASTAATPDQNTTEAGSPLEVGGDVAESQAETDPFNLLVININTQPAGATPGSPSDAEMLKAATEQKLPEAYFNLGVMYIRAGMLDRAWGFFEKALEVEPTFSEAVALQGYIHGLRGQVAEATAFMEKAIAMDKYCAPARNYYARKALGRWQLR